MATLTERASPDVRPARLHSRLLASERGLGYLLLVPTALVLVVFPGDRPGRQALPNTFLYTGVTTVFKLGLGMGMALLLNQAFPFQRFVRAAALLPWIIPTVLST